MKQALWVSDLMARVSAAIGFPVMGISRTELVERNGKVRVCGMAIGPEAPFEFTTEGPFDLDKDGAAPPVPAGEVLYPFAPEFGPQLAKADPYASVDDLWEWSQTRVPVMIEPQMNGFTGIIEKKGGKARLWMNKEKGVDHLAKYPALKEFVIKLPDDFVAEVNVGLERDGQRLPQAEQDVLMKEGMPPEGDKLCITMSDLVYMNEDMHGLQAGERYEKLEKFVKEALAPQPEFRLMPKRAAMDEFQTKTAATWARDFPESNGARISKANSVYSMSGPSEDCVTIGKDDVVMMGIMKSDADERVVYAVVLRPNVLDAQEDIMTPEDVRKAAHYYLENSRTIKLRHGMDPVQKDDPLEAVVLESYVAPADFKLGKGVVKKGDWVMAVRLDDQGVWDKVQSGEYQAFSVGGEGTRQTI